MTSEAGTLKPLTGEAPSVRLEGLDQLWFQVSGTRCNLSCTHCFNESGPESTTFGMLEPTQVTRALEEGRRRGVREVFFTGGEPFLHRDLPAMVAQALQLAPVTILTNATVLPARHVETLRKAAHASRYSLEIRVSLDGESPERNDPLRGEGTFRRILDGYRILHRAGFLPILTVTQTWPEEETLDVLARLQDPVRSRAGSRPRIKVLPALKIGREEERAGSYTASERVTSDMLASIDARQLLCTHARVVTDRGVWVCPILVLAEDARLGDDLQEACAKDYPLAHRACYTCWQYGAICSNFPDPADAG